MKKYVDKDPQQIHTTDASNSSKESTTPSFVDNSSKTQKAAQLQAVANEYATQKNAVFTDNRQSTGVIQAKLKKGKLNVVGERHDISDKRRHEEKWMAANVLKTKNYWTEGMFKTGNPEHYADPFELRVLQAFTMLEEGLNLGHPKLVGQCLAEIRDSCDYVKNEIDGFELSKARKKYYKTLGKQVKKWIKAVIPYTQKEEESARTNMQAILGEHLPEIRQSIAASRELESEALDTSEKIGLQRSIAMHEAANAEAGQEGIWKIGERHVEHIQEENLNDRQYELTNMAEYDQEFKDFKDSKRLFL